MVQPVAFASSQRSIGYFGAAGVSLHRLAQQTRWRVFSEGFSRLATRGPTLREESGIGRFGPRNSLFTLYLGVLLTGLATETPLATADRPWSTTERS